MNELNFGTGNELLNRLDNVWTRCLKETAAIISEDPEAAKQNRKRIIDGMQKFVKKLYCETGLTQDDKAPGRAQKQFQESETVSKALVSDQEQNGEFSASEINNHLKKIEECISELLLAMIERRTEYIPNRNLERIRNGIEMVDSLSNAYRIQEGAKNFALTGDISGNPNRYKYMM